MKSKFFVFFLVHVPKDGPEVLIESTLSIDIVLAKDENEVRTIAARAIPKEYEGVLNEVEIVIRPF